MEAIPLFPTPIFRSSIEISEDLKSLIKDNEFERMPNDSAWYTKNKYLLNSQKLIALKEKIVENLNYYVYNVLEIQPNITFKLLTSWAVKMEEGNWGHKHSHPNSVLSGVVYIETPPNCGDITFYKNHNNIFPEALTVEYLQWNSLNSKAWTYSPREGDILIFPSNLEHSMNTNTSNSDRYSLSFNFFPTGVFGNNECELKIE
jgi:uncharacterized protein (TIGR02466 family)